MNRLKLARFANKREMKKNCHLLVVHFTSRAPFEACIQIKVSSRYVGVHSHHRNQPKAPFQFLYDSALTFFKMKKTSRARWLRRRTRNGMVTPTKYITAPDARPVGFLQLVTWVVPCLVSKTSLFITSHMPIAESQPKLPNPKLPMENSKTAGLMIRKEKTQMSPQLTMVA